MNTQTNLLKNATHGYAKIALSLMLLFMSTTSIVVAQTSSNAPTAQSTDDPIFHPINKSIFRYAGPKDTKSLGVKLKSSNPTLKKLDDQTRSSLMKYMIFEDGFWVAMNGTDANIDKLFATNAKEVLTALLGMKVIIHTGEEMPTVRQVSTQEFRKIIRGSSPYTTVMSTCTNCEYWTKIDKCCHPAQIKFRCGDKLCEYPVNSGTYYRVVQ